MGGPFAAGFGDARRLAHGNPLIVWPMPRGAAPLEAVGASLPGLGRDRAPSRRASAAGGDIEKRNRLDEAAGRRADYPHHNYLFQGFPLI